MSLFWRLELTGGLYISEKKIINLCS